MLETYFVKPQTVDRIRACWIGAEIERYNALYEVLFKFKRGSACRAAILRRKIWMRLS